MTTNGEPIKIIKKIKPVSTWITFDFVNYFYNKCSNIYGHENVDRDIERDGMVMKRLIGYFSENNMSKIVVKRFLDWAIDKYLNDTKFVIPVTIGFIHFWRGEYLNRSVEVKSKKQKKKQIVVQPLSEETQKFLDQERVKYYKPKTRVRKRK